MEILGNKLAYKTYRHTKVNDVSIFLPEIQEGFSFPVESTGAFEERPELKDYTYGVAQEAIDLNREKGSIYRKYHVEKDQVEKGKTLKLTTTDQNYQLLDTHDIIVEEGGKFTLTLSYDDQGEEEKFRNSLIRIVAKKGAEVNVYLIQKENKSMSLESVVILAEEKAKVRLRQYEMGAVKNYMNTQVELVGQEADVDVRSIYFGHEDNELNILYHINHHKPKTKANVVINGALMDQAQKNLKTTLDFKQGTQKSQGNEEEYTVLLDDTVLNLSVPVLLSHEDDIAGNHAASSGEIDADLLFYLKSRGISHQLAETLIVESKYAGTIDLLKDEKEKEEIWKYFRNKMNKR